MSESFLILRRIERDIVVRSVRSYIYEMPLTLVSFNKTLIFSTVFGKKFSNTKFHGNPRSGHRVVPCEHSDRHDEASCLFTQIYVRV